MIVKEVFSKLYETSKLQNLEVWEYEFDAENIELIQNVETLFQNEICTLFSYHQSSEFVIPIINANFDQIIERKQEDQFSDFQDIFSYLQFIWGLSTVSQLNSDREFIYTFRIFMRSVIDREITQGDEYSLDELSLCTLLSSQIEYVANSKSVILQWFSQLYFYSKSFSGLNEWCDEYFEWVYYQINRISIIEEYYPQLLSNVFGWCQISQNKNRSSLLKRIIYRAYYNLNWSNNVNENYIKGQLGLQILLLKENLKDKIDLFDELNKYHKLTPALRLQGVNALCYDMASLTNNYQLLSDSLSEFNEFINTVSKDEFQKIYIRTAFLKNLLQYSILVALEGEKVYLIEDIIIKFFDIKNPKKSGNILFILPNTKMSITYCFPEEVKQVKKDTQNITRDLVEVENRAFNSFRILKGGFNKDIKPTGKVVGQPNKEHSKEYEDVLNNLYDFDKFQENLKEVDSLIQFDFNSSPLQKLMSNYNVKVLPINLSLSDKNEFPSKIRNIVFWSGTSLTSQIETEVLDQIFSSCGINFEIHNSENSSKKNFLEIIGNLDPEVVWISSHGEHEHFEPNKSKIIFDEQESIPIREYNVLLNNSKNRRLLFLNVCEGGVHSQTGEFKNIGFPNLLTSNNQDVISHLWMVDTHFATVFGVLVAIGITFKNLNYFEAFSYTLETVKHGKVGILKVLKNSPIELTDIIERVNNNDSIDWHNIITTGSPVYHI